jgi:hypothetical protein
MPTSLPPLPADIGDNTSEGTDDTQTVSAFSGGQPPIMQAIQDAEGGLKKLATLVPSLLPMCAQMISALRTAVPDATAGAGAGMGPSGGPTGPAITGMGSNPTALPAPPQGI